jgi:Flp pilus assembly protein TadG
MRGRAAGRNDRGASAIELSIVAPVVLLLIFFTVQVALWLYGRSVALAAAREGVSTLRLADDRDVPAVEAQTAKDTESYAVKVGGQSLLQPKAVAVYNTTTGRVKVTVTGHVVSLVGLDLSVSRTATGEIERFSEDVDD